jgi:hypothetical protein
MNDDEDFSSPADDTQQIVHSCLCFSVSLIIRTRVRTRVRTRAQRVCDMYDVGNICVFVRTYHQALEGGAAAAGATTSPSAAAAHRRDNNDMPRDGGGGGQAVATEGAVGVGRAVVEKCNSPCWLPKQQKLGDTPLTKHLCPRSRNTINTLATLPAVAHLALVVWLCAITSNAQVVGTVNQGTASSASSE